MNKKNLLLFRLLFFVILLLLMVLAYSYLPIFREFIQQALQSTESVHDLKLFIQSHGAYSIPVIIFFLTLLQAFITILPLMVVMAAATLTLGMFWGTIVMVISQVLAGWIVFRLTKYFGRPLIEKYVAEEKLERVNKVITQYGRWGVLIARMIPFGSFDLVNFASGLLNVKDRDFIIGTVLGVIPATLFYGVIGINIEKPSSISLTSYILFSSLIIFFILVIIFVKRNHSKTK